MKDDSYFSERCAPPTIFATKFEAGTDTVTAAAELRPDKRDLTVSTTLYW